MASKPEASDIHETIVARRPQGAGLLLFDLDDTIVQAGSYVSERVIRTLAAAKEAGYVLAVASGRPLCAVHKQILDTRVMDYAVCANGSTVTRLCDGVPLYHEPMTQKQCLRCYELLKPFGPGWNLFAGDDAYFEWRGASYMLTGRTGAVARALRRGETTTSAPGRCARLVRRAFRFARRLIANPHQHQVFSIAPYLRRAFTGVDKIGCSIPSATHCAQAAALLEAEGCFEVVRMGATELEITAAGVTKATGATVLMDLVGFDPGRVVAFGDSSNDVPLAGVVGRFVAMGNADEQVKASADDVCGRVSEDGVAVWIEQHLLGRH